MKWYVIHTHSGAENRARLALEERIKANGLQQYFSEILVPSESVIETVKGQKRASVKKFFPGYMLVKMELNEESWYLVNNTPKISGFVGNKTKPSTISEDEVRKLTKQIDEGKLKTKPTISFEKGENIRVVDGPFSNFSGMVDEVRPDKGKLRVLVSIFGRATPVELDFAQVEKN